MAEIKVMTDSTSDIPANLISELGIEVLPVNISLDGTIYRDKLDIHSDTFYRNMDSYSRAYSQEISYMEYAYTYKRLVYRYDHLLIIHCSRHINRTYDNAAKVHEDFYNTHGCKVSLFDSGLCGLGLGLLVIEAAKAVRAGYSFSQVNDQVIRRREEISSYFYVPSLKYLHKSRKLSGLGKALGSAFRIHPILTFRKGQITLTRRLTGEHQIMGEKLVQVIQQEFEGQEIYNLGIVHALAPKMGEEIRDLMLRNFSCSNVYESHLGISLGLHTGPGAVGVFYTHK